MDPFSPDNKPMRKGNFFNFDDNFESQVTSDEYQDMPAKEFRSSSMAQGMKHEAFAIQEDETGLKMGAPLFQPEQPVKIEITATKAVRFSKQEIPQRTAVNESVDELGKEVKPADVILDLLLRKHTWIGRFRRLSDKRELLELSLKTYNYNVIYPVLWHLKQTLSNEILIRTLKEFPKSKMHYFTLLREKGLDQELILVTHACGEYEKSGQLRLEQAHKAGDPYKQLLMLKDCENYFKKMRLDKLAGLVSDQRDLLDAQLSIHTFEKSTGMIQQGVGSVEIFSPVLKTPNYTTLYYLCLQHFECTTGLACPATFCEKFSIPNVHFVWIALSARSQLKDWICVDGILKKKYQTKSWFGMGKATSFIIAPEKVVEIFHKKDSTPWGESGNELRDSIILTLLNQTEDLEERYMWSFLFLCHPVVIETLAKLKSRKRLEGYIEKVPPYSKYRRQIGDKLGSKAIAWKDT